ncbi:uncharacterized protein EV422DRAFT_507996 [Fimicolochytrium jonesii]|uniref:uncharacterized protein n=1 Tax=Fimicolochytrium jonesii TaxID=1396493 RepID=UPI0022FE355F|nr:uncharacterized protein EV422DRAFT_507996 [Fimicolochytrium jonesii]KAI8818841.1 hypothetical protein EV422DRAFT_507996 [Fimicolochytrium jonesii]
MGIIPTTALPPPFAATYIDQLDTPPTAPEHHLHHGEGMEKAQVSGSRLGDASPAESSTPSIMAGDDVVQDAIPSRDSKHPAASDATTTTTNVKIIPTNPLSMPPPQIPFKRTPSRGPLPPSQTTHVVVLSGAPPGLIDIEALKAQLKVLEAGEGGVGGGEGSAEGSDEQLSKSEGGGDVATPPSPARRSSKQPASQPIPMRRRNSTGSMFSDSDGDDGDDNDSDSDRRDSTTRDLNASGSSTNVLVVNLTQPMIPTLPKLKVQKTEDLKNNSDDNLEEVNANLKVVESPARRLSGESARHEGGSLDVGGTLARSVSPTPAVSTATPAVVAVATTPPAPVVTRSTAPLQLATPTTTTPPQPPSTPSTPVVTLASPSTTTTTSPPTSATKRNVTFATQVSIHTADEWKAQLRAYRKAKKRWAIGGKRWRGLGARRITETLFGASV